MPDLLPYAMRYKVQSFWPLPTIEDLKKPDRRWKALQSRQLTAQEMHEAWPPKGNANVAVVCGPAAHLLVLNVNLKNGVDGRMLLQQRGLEIPRTPEVITPSGGAAYLFKVQCPQIDSTDVDV
jgi:Bifunctional DNA primase/polymerase, N-terminal